MSGNLTQSHYEVLSISRIATDAEIKTAFKKAALMYHPDKAGPGGQEMFIKCRQAFDVLSDAQRRKDYDLEEANPRPAFQTSRPFYANPQPANAYPQPSYPQSGSNGSGDGEDWQARWAEAKREGDEKRRQRKEDEARNRGYRQEEPKTPRFSYTRRTSNVSGSSPEWQSRGRETRRDSKTPRNQRSGSLYEERVPHSSSSRRASKTPDYSQGWQSHERKTRQDGKRMRHQRSESRYEERAPRPSSSRRTSNRPEHSRGWQSRGRETRRDSKTPKNQRSGSLYEESVPRPSSRRSASQAPPIAPDDWFARMREARRESERSRSRRREEETRSQREDIFSGQYPFNSPYQESSRTPYGTQWMPHAELLSATVRAGRRLTLLIRRLQNQQQNFRYLDIGANDHLLAIVDKLGDVLNDRLNTSKRIEDELTRVAYWEWDSCPSKPESLVNCEVVSDIVDGMNSLAFMVSNVERGVDELFQFMPRGSDGSGIPSYEFGAAKLRLRTTLSRALADIVSSM